jgi:hypothetical protein
MEDCHAPYKLVKMRAAFIGDLSHETTYIMKRRNSLHRKMVTYQKFQMHLQYRLLRNNYVTLQRKDTIKNNVTKFSGLANNTEPFCFPASSVNNRQVALTIIVKQLNVLMWPISLIKSKNSAIMYCSTNIRNQLETHKRNM